MPNHFGRFRVINDTPAGADARVIRKATFKIGSPQVLHTVVGFGTQFPEVPEQYFAELGLDEGIAQADKVIVDIEIYEQVNPANVETITNWELDVASAVLLQSVDIKILHKAAPPNYRARATVAGDNYAFKEETKNF